MGLVKFSPRITGREYLPVTRAGALPVPKWGPRRKTGRMQGCEVLWDAAKAERVQQLIEMGTGALCPCRTGGRCPILPKTLAVVPRPS